MRDKEKIMIELVLYCMVLAFCAWFTLGAIIILGLELGIRRIGIRELAARPERESLFFKSLAAAIMFTLFWPLSIYLILTNRLGKPKREP